METLQYPIGKYIPQPYSAELKATWMNDIKYLPTYLENALLNLDEAQLDTPYRPEGWTVKQVVHHLADSHSMAYIRTKFALIQNCPTVMPYEESQWVNAADIVEVPTNMNVTLLYVLHAKWWSIWNAMTETDFDRTYFHPEHGKEFTLWYVLGLYAWHCKHHVAHITTLRERMNW